MTNDAPNLAQRITNIEASITKLDSGWQRQHNLLLDEIIVTNDQMTGITRQLDQLIQRVDRLAQNQEVVQSNINNLAQVMVQFAQNAERDRAQMRDTQASIEQIWQYLLSQRPNGHH